MQNQFNKTFTACALALTLTACDKKVAPEPSTFANTSGEKISLPAASPTGEKFHAGVEVANTYSVRDFCKDFNKNTCTGTETLIARTADQIQIQSSRIVKLEPGGISNAQSMYFAHAGEYAKNPGLFITVPQTLKIEKTGLCTTAHQVKSDLGKVSVQIIDDINNGQSKKVDIPDDYKQKFIGVTQTAASGILGDVFCSHYAYDKATDTILEYQSVDGFLQPTEPTKRTLLEKTPTSAFSLRFEK